MQPIECYSKGNMDEWPGAIISIKIHDPLPNFWTWFNFEPRTYHWRRPPGGRILKHVCVFRNEFLSPSPKGQWPLTLITLHWEKWNAQTFPKTVEHRADTDTWRPRALFWTLFDSGGIWKLIISGVLDWVWLTVNSLNLWIHLIIISLVPPRTIRVDVLSSWHNLHIGFLACGVGDIVQMETPEMASFYPVNWQERKPEIILHSGDNSRY